MNETHKAMLIILDGWGLGNHDKADVISQTPTPYFDSLMETYPNSQLQASGENVGLPDGQMGNSEVGHLNIGAGRIVYQDLVKINRAIQDKSFFSHPTLVEAMNTAKENSKAIHFLGLVSPGGVHSMDSHLVALSEMAGEFGLEKVYIHALTDGRDTDPKSGLGYVKNLLTNIEHTPARLATLVGRYYSMDRDKRWDRVKRGYDLLVNGVGEKSQDIIASIEKSYSNNITDEFIEPILMVDENNEAIGQIQEGDVVVAFNFRTDRLRQMTHVLTQEDMPEHGMKTLPLHYYTMTRYDDKFKGVNVIYDKENVQNSIGEILSNLGKTQLRIAETEKYAHVTFFFSGGREEEFQGESRIMVSSPKVATYDLQPEMSAPEVADKLVNELKSGKHDFVCLNFANGDMVGHTGIYEAIEKAVKTVDTQLQKVVETGKEENYDIIIIADHGNADNAVNSDGSPNTAHSLNPVPFIVITDRFKNAENGRLADVAPSLLKLMNLDVPEEMTGSVLIS